MTYVDFFSNLGFDFNVNLKPKDIDIEKGTSLYQKLADSVFFYKSPNNTNTSFYLVTSALEKAELEQFRKYVWNKNDADIIFYYPNETDKVKMFYAKYSPKVSNIDSVLEVFSTTEKDLDKIEKIRHWQFDSGVFWLNYHLFIDKTKYKGIDKELVVTLKSLKEQLSKLLTVIKDVEKRNEVVQALIDRTLYIKYLEDNHIINSYFFTHYFKDGTLNYQTLLEKNSNEDINKLYKIIHEIFNNALFDQPTIDNKHLTKEVRTLIANSFNHNITTGQLRLFDFSFNVLPVEFISYIYEVFLSEKQKENGIYYTPKKLAQLIVDDVIITDKIGSILDPSSGSGMFLITGYQRLLEISQRQNLEPQDSIEKIKYRTKLLSENIFGIEKELTAQRFTLFSLSLQIFNGIDPEKIKEFIASELKENKKINLFSEYSFFQNIKHANTLSTSDTPFENILFTYIVGNPPFFAIPNTEEFCNEISFLNTYQVKISDNTKKIAKNIVGKSQISQCFFLKIKEWSDENTRFGFVSNSSNFYNDYSEVFQSYFYSHYGIEKVYELSRVKKILFEKAQESVLAVIFSNNIESNTIDYYPVDLGLFSEKPFELLIIQEDKAIVIEQDDLASKRIRLRDFLVGNEYDNLLVKKLHNANFLEDYIYKEEADFFLHRGIEIVGFEEIEKEFNISKENWSLLTPKQKNEYYLSFKNMYSSFELTDDFPIPFIKPGNIDKFHINSFNSYLGNDITMFHRPRKRELYYGKRIIWSRIGKSLKAVYLDGLIYFDFDLYVLKLENEEYYNLIVAILNSDLINYFSNIHLKKRIDGSFPKIGIEDIKKIPVAIDLDNELSTKISNLSKDLSLGKFNYAEKELQLNELIFDLYELSYWEKQRVKDYFLPKSRIGRNKKALIQYKNTLQEIIEFYFETPIIIDVTSADFNLIVVKITFSNNSTSPEVDKTKKYLLNEIFEQNSNANFLASQEKIFGKDCVFIVKEDINKNWTETKAFEDGQDILKHLISTENGERVHQD